MERSALGAQGTTVPTAVEGGGEEGTLEGLEPKSGGYQDAVTVNTCIKVKA